MARVVASESGNDLSELEARQDPRLLRALDMVAPGTPLREGIDNIIHARTGGLILIADAEDVSFLFSGGIKLDIDYTPALLYQVAKMDGAIVLDAGSRKISWANVQLMPDPTILSMETGTRHRTAERVSKQAKALVVAISQRRDVVSLYVEGIKYILEDIPTVLSKANQGLATLEKYRDRLDQVAARLSARELNGMVALYDALTVIQRAELVTRMAAEVERYIIELGAEGRLIEMQLEETVVGVMAERAAGARDYIVVDSEPAVERALSELGSLEHQELLDFGRLAELLGYDRKTHTIDFPVSPRGYRALASVPRLPRLVAQKVVHRFGDLAAILAATDQELEAVDGVGEMHAKEIREGLRRLEVDEVDRYR
ncbi:MAG TPA: DNA integrity scanning diadenylate cyclase DisA [Solirubrobacterales bacterium]|nr:DNA integrity scanning diadenylate cyclase DisA [Solirubrobacterales bacterium]